METSHSFPSQHVVIYCFVFVQSSSWPTRCWSCRCCHRTWTFKPGSWPFEPKSWPFATMSWPFTPRAWPFAPRAWPFTPRSWPFAPRAWPFAPWAWPFAYFCAFVRSWTGAFAFLWPAQAPSS